MNILNYSELLRNMNLATRSLIARVAIALNDMQLVVLPAKSETGDVIPNKFIFLEYTEKTLQAFFLTNISKFNKLKT